MILKSNKNLELYIFDVGRGLSILCKTPQNQVILYDLGSSSDFSPINKLYSHKDFFSQIVKSDDNRFISQTIISHPHLDHISDLTDENFDFINENSSLITCQNDKIDKQEEGHKINFDYVNNPKENCSQIENYKSLYRERNLPLVTMNSVLDGVDFKFGYYYLTHKQIDEYIRSSREQKDYNADYSDNEKQNYSNSLSIVFYLNFNGLSVLLPGDIPPWGFEEIIKGNCEKRFTNTKKIQNVDTREKWISSTCDQPKLGTLLSQGLTVLVAPHHGLESGYCEYLFSILKEKLPKIIIISEKSLSSNSGKTHQNYQNGKCSTGWKINDEKDARFSLTTRKDKNIKISISENHVLKITTTNTLEDFFNE